jgi:hypothetical protein
MSTPSNQSQHEIAFEAFGVPVVVSVTSAEDLELVHAFLPPGWRATDPSNAEKRFAVLSDGRGQYRYARDEELFNISLSRELALELLEAQMRAYIALHARSRIFVHAGVVAKDGRGLILPGVSFAGKTTLVAALVRAGALYYSDEFAVLDLDGNVHPYPKALSLRGDGRTQVDHAVETLGGQAGDEGVRANLIVVTQYRPGADWQPERRSPGEGAIALMANTVAARERPPEVMQALSRAVDGAAVLEGDRGEADDVVPKLLEELEKAG